MVYDVKPNVAFMAIDCFIVRRVRVRHCDRFPFENKCLLLNLRELVPIRYLTKRVKSFILFLSLCTLF